MQFINGTMLLGRSETVAFLIARDGDMCQYDQCPNPHKFTEANPRTLDHVIPRAKGGTDEVSNLELFHQKCNNHKGDRSYIGVDENGLRLLEPLPFKEPKSTVVKRPPTSCCNEGRDLKQGEVCEICGLNPQPESFPRWAKLEPKECEHSGPWWCWACSIGLYERVPASSDVFGTLDDL